jgi:protocatechuate 3,4-dioxygenase beta subunit
LTRILIALGALVFLLLAGWMWLGSDAAGERARREKAPEETVVAPSRETRPPSREPESTSPAWRVVGRVTGGDTSRVRVRVLLDMDSHIRVLGETGVTEGAYGLDTPQLEGLTEVQRRRAKVVADVRGRGRSKELELQGVEAGEIRLDVELKDVALITGRVLDRAGNLVRDAEVWFSPRALAGSADTDEQGRYALPITQVADHWICARHGELGFAVTGPVPLTPQAGYEAPDLRLDGPGMLKGIAVYPDGTPAVNLSVYAMPEALKESKIGQLPGPRFDGSLEQEPGNPWGWTTTAEDGRFRMSGLRTGQYFFYSDKKRTLYPVGSEVRLVVERYRIRVRFRDDAGRPVHGYALGARSDRGSSVAGFTTGPDAEMDIGARPGETWSIFIGSEVIEPVTRVVRVEKDTHEYLVVLPVRLARERGRLEVHLLDPAGEPVEDVRVSLYSGQNVILYETRAPDGVTPLVPVARYRLEAFGGDPFALFFPAKHEVEVVANATRPVTVRARPAGRLRLTLKVDDAPDFLPGLYISAVPQQGVGRIYLGGTLRRTENGWSMSSRRPLNEPFLCENLLEPGPYELRIEAEKLRTVALPTTIRPGEVTDLEVELARE